MPLTELYLDTPNRLAIFVLVLTRISGLLLTAPVLGVRSAPFQVRAVLAVGVSLLVTPLLFDAPLADPGTLVNLAAMMAGEAIIGVALGLGVMILFSGVQLTGQIVGQMSGAQIADVFDPTYDQSVPIYAQLLDSVTLTVFLIIGGHREVVDALLGTFRVLPLGGGGFHEGMAEAMFALVTQSFSLGIRAAAPAMVALLMSILVLGLISRTLPQLNILAVGFSTNAVVMLAVMAMSLGGVVWVFQDQVGPTIDGLRDAISAPAEPVARVDSPA
ncbi:MAG: flagellar biosynthetic protein FliR [Planctomycetales bacterium]|nr:flagellar biosynthetic protein FliR [Planctomycetales bacterium]